MTAEPARISEFVIASSDGSLGGFDRGGGPITGEPATTAGAESSSTDGTISSSGRVRVAPRTVSQVRADGIVVSTPAGSHGYAAAADGPLLAPGAGLAIVPIAPFVTDVQSWVVPSGPISLTVRRDDVPATVRLDGRRVTTIDHTDELLVEPAGELTVVVTPESEPLASDDPTD